MYQRCTLTITAERTIRSGKRIYYVKLIYRKADTERIKRLEAEVADLRREQIILRQNKTMIECVENVTKYEKQLVDAIEEMATDMANALRNANGE